MFPPSIFFDNCRSGLLDEVSGGIWMPKARCCNWAWFFKPPSLLAVMPFFGKWKRRKIEKWPNYDATKFIFVADFCDRTLNKNGNRLKTLTKSDCWGTEFSKFRVFWYAVQCLVPPELKISSKIRLNSKKFPKGPNLGRDMGWGVLFWFGAHANKVTVFPN